MKDLELDKKDSYFCVFLLSLCDMKAIKLETERRWLFRDRIVVVCVFISLELLAKLVSMILLYPFF